MAMVLAAIPAALLSTLCERIPRLVLKDLMMWSEFFFNDFRKNSCMESQGAPSFGMGCKVSMSVGGYELAAAMVPVVVRLSVARAGFFEAEPDSCGCSMLVSLDWVKVG